MNEIKSKDMTEKDNIIEELDKHFNDLNEVYQVFKEQIMNNKWTEIPNKNLYFNRNIMACYPNFLNNFQELIGSFKDGYETLKKKINENEEYAKYEIEWDIPTINENINSFYDKEHPMESDNRHRINDKCCFIYRDRTYIYWYDNDPGYIGRGGLGDDILIIPIFRLGKVDDLKRYKSEEIFEYFLKNDFIIVNIYEDLFLKKSFQKLVRYIDYIDKITEIDGELSLEWNLEKIEEEIILNENRNGLFCWE